MAGIFGAWAGTDMAALATVLGMVAGIVAVWAGIWLWYVREYRTRFHTTWREARRAMNVFRI